MPEKFFYCAYPFCDYKGTTGLFGFPKDETKRQEWIKIFGIKGEILSRSKICFKHFNVQDVIHEQNGQMIINENFKPGHDQITEDVNSKEIIVEFEDQKITLNHNLNSQENHQKYHFSTLQTCSRRLGSSRSICDLILTDFDFNDLF